MSTKTSQTKNYHHYQIENDQVKVFDSLNRLYYDFETKFNTSFVIKSGDTKENNHYCYITHKNSFFFYGGSRRPNQISKFDCHQSKVPENFLKFNFTGGTCASNNENVLLCFPTENKRLCYKSINPSPRIWWQWFTYVDFSYTTHNAISLSSGE